MLADNKEDVAKFADFSPPSAVPAETPAAETTIKATTPSSDTTQTSNAAAGHSSSASDRVLASPIAKAIAADRGIPLDAVTGTGPNGRILKTDVENFKQKPASAAATKAAPKSAAPVAAASSAFTDIPLSNVRKVIASRLTESKVTIPHYYLTVNLNADKILKLREILNKEGNGKFKLSVNDFVVKAASLALKDVPEVNSAWQDTFIRQFKSADIAVAVATESGLITPIVQSAETKGLSSISNQIKEMAEKARSGKLAPHEYQGGTFTISNLGMFGIQHFTAIINPPHAGILAVGGLEDKIVLDETAEKGFRATKTMNVTLSNDHRVVDGAVGAKWLQRFKLYFENPLTMML